MTALSKFNKIKSESDIMTELNISRDEYQAVTCEISGDNCYWHSCSDCQTAIEYATRSALTEERMDIMAAIEDLTNISKDTTFGSIKCTGNEGNTIGKFMNVSVDEVCAVMPSAEFVKYELRGEIPDLDIWYPEWRKLQVYNALPSPDYFMYAKDYPLIAVYSGVLYGVAPRIEE